jgi:hypothetical protein
MVLECRRFVVLSPWYTALTARHGRYTGGLGILTGLSHSYLSGLSLILLPLSGVP